MISLAKRQLVKIAQKQLGLDDDNYHALLLAEAGVDSSTDLDENGFERVMKRFQKMGFVSTFAASKKVKVKHSPGDRITRRQQWKIAGNFAAMGCVDREAQLNFIERQIGVRRWPQTVKEGQKVIDGQGAIIARRSS